MQQRHDRQRRETEQVDDRLSTQPAMVIGTDQRAVGGERNGAGELHDRKDQETSGEATAHGGVTTEQVGHDWAGRREQQGQTANTFFRSIFCFCILT